MNWGQGGRGGVGDRDRPDPVTPSRPDPVPSSGRPDPAERVRRERENARREQQAAQAAEEQAAVEERRAAETAELGYSPPVDRFGTPDWQQLRHWKYCVGGRYDEVRRRTTVSAADNVIMGFRIGAAAANLLPGIGLLVSGAIAGLGWTLQALGLFARREPGYKLIRTQFKKMFQEDIVIPIIPLTDNDWCLAVPEVPVSAIFEVVEAFRKHTFEKLGIAHELRSHETFIAPKWKATSPPSTISDIDKRHYFQCVDWLHVYEVANLPNKIEWIFCFGAVDQVSMDVCRSVGTDLAGLSANERDRAIAELREQGEVPGRDIPDPDDRGYENGEGSGMGMMAIFIAAAILLLIAGMKK